MLDYCTDDPSLHLLLLKSSLLHYSVSKTDMIMLHTKGSFTLAEDSSTYLVQQTFT